MIRSYTLAILCCVMVILGSGCRASEDERRKLMPRSVSRTIDIDRETNIAKVPWQVSLIKDFGPYGIYYKCGGSIISSHWVVTAASCICESKNQSDLFPFVSAGSSDYTKGSKHKVIEKICHPLYGKRMQTRLIGVHDIALLRVGEPFIFDRTRQPIPLYNETYETVAQSRANTSGWGSLQLMSEKTNRNLTFATMEIISIPEHESLSSRIYNKSVPTGQIWAKPLSGSVCYSDSGGPLTINGTLVGIASWLSSDFCIIDRPVLYTEVAQYYSWILKNALH